MVGSWSALGGRYICALRYPRHVPGACAGRSLSAPTIEQRVWEHVQTLLSDPDVLRHQYEQGRGDPAVDVQAEHERARLERKLAALEREKTRLLDAYQAEVIELPELAERRQRLTEQGQLLRARVQEIEQQRLDRAAELRLLEGVEAFCASIRDAMVAPSFEVKQKVLQLIVQRIVVEVRQADASYALGLFNFGGVAGALAGALVIQALGSRVALLTLSGLSVISALLLTSMPPTVQAPFRTMLLFAVSGALLNAVQTTMYALAAHVFPTAIRGTGVGATMAVGRVGNVLASYVGSWALTTGGPPLYFSTWAVAMSVVFVALASIRRHIPRA